MKYYYILPFNARELMEKRKYPLCNLKDSVQQNMNLIIKTHLKEYRYDDAFGCLIWNKDYSVVTNVSEWKDELKSLMQSAIEKNEPRISKVKINLNLETVEFVDQFRNIPLKLKNKITIHITGVISHLNETIEHFEYLFFSPLSIG